MRVIRTFESGYMFSSGDASLDADYDRRHEYNGLYNLSSSAQPYIGFKKWVEGMKPSNVSGGSTLPNIEFVEFADGTILQKKCYDINMYSTVIDGIKNNYVFFNSSWNVGDGKGTFGDNGAGEPLEINGTQYKMRMFGFGKTKSDIGTAVDGVTKYIINSEPKDVIELRSGAYLVSANNGWRDTANSFQYNPDTGFEFRAKDRYGSRNYGLVFGTPPEVKTVVDVDGLKWDMASGKYLGPTTKTAPVFVARTYRQTDTTVPILTATIDGEQVLSKNNVKANEAVSIDLADWWSRAADGWHEMTLSAGTGAKKSFDTVVRFKKGIVGLEVTGKPSDRDKMPTACFIASAVNLAEKATATWYVCNNANDAAPAWEEYNGGRHVFANKNKTSEKWAVAWRIVVDNGTSARRSELIKHVAMAVM